ncbi:MULTISPECIES: Ger(x)C family spore germination protein [Psychrobacillus]|jgi:Ger(x)C family germination protein|uniref:Ger(X)C family spore germination protein n=2 Tax=Psychrobacillus TaxID=1221880 RepID=A0A544SZQ8_9BACI|nr:MULTISPECIES: Ger(x)C family spore germination protein [Psychrobacillus]MBD7946419.1 Ger(x)C family spore germination protein [Psychrobacillus faecigallinarum]TQR10688.1 Ger(x)C family spore germination protein [Psychrobacillus lasiicapitis]GGA43445.1 putative spore germination protein YfkR [Psychrobacillus lasiicapitis]
MKQSKILIICFILLFLTGCWDEKEIGEVDYITTLGIDYKDENYIIYVQMLDFSNVAKQEVSKVSQPATLYIGKSSGKNINDAVYNLYRTTQQQVNWSHVGAIIYSESVLKKGIENVEQSLIKHGDFRYTPWMFGTTESIEEILSTTGFFQLPPLYTILYKPNDMYKIYSYIEPMRMHRFISEYKEPGGTALLPSLTINETDWKQSVEEPKSKKVLQINGAFPVSNGTYKEWLSYEEIAGLRWTQTQTQSTPVDIVIGDEIKGTVRIMKPSAKVDLIRKGNDFHFNINVEAEGTLIDLEDQLSLKKIQELVSKQIEKEIRTTYLKGIDKDADVYNLKNVLFHDRIKPEQLNDYPLTADSLNKITVNFILKSKGAYE